MMQRIELIYISHNCKSLVINMAIYTFSEISALTGVPNKTLHVYASPKRRKLIKNEDGKIDTSNPINDLFLKKKAIKYQNDQIKAESTQQESKEENQESEQEKKTTRTAKSNVKSDAIISEELEKVQLTNRKIRLDVELKEEELKKNRGETIDLKESLIVFKTYSGDMKKEFVQSMQILIQDICARHEIEPGKAGEYKLKVLDLINESSKKSINQLLDQFGHE